MRVPCGSCGVWTSVQAGSNSFRCSCGTLNSFQELSAAAAPAAVAAPAPTRSTPAAALPRVPRKRAAASGSAAWKKVLVSLVVVAAFGSVLHQGTFATFNATTSQNAAITTGTLLLGNTVGANAECLSTPNSGGPSTTITTNVNNACTTLFSAPFGAGASSTVNLVIKNEGNLAASSLVLYVPIGAPFPATGCSTIVASGANAITIGGTTFQGNAANDLCAGANGVQTVVFETTSGTSCVYGSGAAGLPVAGCSYAAGKIIGNSGVATSLAGTCTAGTPCLAGGLAAGATRSFTIGVKFPDPNDNSFQALSANFSITWKLIQ